MITSKLVEMEPGLVIGVRRRGGGFIGVRGGGGSCYRGKEGGGLVIGVTITIAV